MAILQAQGTITLITCIQYAPTVRSALSHTIQVWGIVYLCQGHAKCLSSNKRTTPHFLFILTAFVGVGEGYPINDMKKIITYDELKQIVISAISQVTECIAIYHKTDVLSYDESLYDPNGLSKIDFSIYDISQVATDIAPYIKANPDSFVTKEMICNNSLRIFSCGYDYLEFMQGSTDKDNTHMSISLKPGFYRWLVKQLFNKEIDPKNDDDLTSVQSLFLNYILGSHIIRCKILSSYMFGEVIILIKDIKYK